MDEEISLIGRTPSLIKLNDDVRESLNVQSPSIYEYILDKFFAIKYYMPDITTIY